MEKIVNNPRWIEANRVSHTGKKYSEEVNKSKGRVGKDHPRTKLYKITTPDGNISFVIREWKRQLKEISQMNYANAKKAGYKIEFIGIYKEVKHE